MGKYGQKNHVKLDPLAYNICLLGESKVGKTTLIKEVCEKLAGSDGYTINAEASYDDAAIPVTNKGNPYAEGQIKAGRVSKTSSTITSYRNTFYNHRIVVLKIYKISFLYPVKAF